MDSDRNLAWMNEKKTSIEHFKKRGQIYMKGKNESEAVFFRVLSRKIPKTRREGGGGNSALPPRPLQSL